MDLYLVRHTRVDVRAGLCYGRLEVPVADSFADEAARVKGFFAGFSQFAVVSSPSQRCAQLARALGDEAYFDPDLRELHFGEWEGRLWSEIPRSAIDRWAEDLSINSPPSGETYSDLRIRIQRALVRIHQGGAPRVVCVTHGGPIRVFLAMALGLTADRVFQFAIDYGSVTLIRWPSQGHVQIGYVNRPPCLLHCEVP